MPCLDEEIVESRADPGRLEEVFTKYASLQKDNERFMSYDDFVRKFLGLFSQPNFDRDTVRLLGTAVDTHKKGYITFDDFHVFEGLLASPDALYALAFNLFDRNGQGIVTFENFKKVIESTTVNRHLPFDFDKSEFIKSVFGENKDRQVHFTEFTQILHDFHEEHAIQAFRSCDSENTGFITTYEFNDIMMSLKDHLLSPSTRSNLIRLGGLAAAHKVSFAYFTAFIALMNDMELIKKIFMNAAKGNVHKELSQDEFLTEAQGYTQITPLEVFILYQIVDLFEQNHMANYKVLERISPTQYHHLPFAFAKVLQEKVEDVAQQTGRRSVWIGILENTYRFILGGIAGAIGATTVYPIDLVKTRLQNQRSTIGELLYKNTIDCFQKVIRYEGFMGLYRGLGPQIVGVAPEKAIKLTVNDLVRDQFTDEDGNIPIPAELLAGFTAGTTQVMFTNPLEIVKIRLQVAGELAATGAARPSAILVIKDLGLFGLYKGAHACVMRDAPFSAVYFTGYNHCKRFLADAEGCPAASLVTPADVIKTRLQVKARSGQTLYKGMFDCIRTILREEGAKAFWKGAGARMVRSSPQFGITLLSYELLQRHFYIDFGGRKLEGAPELYAYPDDLLPENPDHIGGYKHALSHFAGIETKFGLQFPKYRSPYVQT